MSSCGYSWYDFTRDIKQIGALLKMNIIRQKRSVSAIFEIFASLITPFIVLLITKTYTLDFKEIKNVNLTKETLSKNKLLDFLKTTEDSTFIVCPDNSNTRAIIRLAFGSYINLYHINLKYVDSPEKMDEEIYKSSVNGVGIEWRNSESVNGSQSPDIVIHYQDYGAMFPFKDIYRALKQTFAYNKGFASLASSEIMAGEMTRPHVMICDDLRVTLMLFCTCPCVLISIHVFQDLIDDRENKVLYLMKIIGCKERCVWISMFITAFIPSIISYALFCFVLCLTPSFRGVSFSLMYVISILFSLAHILSMMVLVSLIQNSRQARVLTMVNVILVLFMTYFNYNVTGKSYLAKEIQYVTSFMPISDCQLAFCYVYNYTVYKNMKLTWDNIHEEFDFFPIFYSILIHVIWISIYAVVFFFFNRMFPESKCFISSRKAKYEPKEEYKEVIHVKELTKVYEGSNKKALDNVEFVLNKGETMIVIGPNGAGKSTLINIISGIIQPNSGTISILEGVPTPNFEVMQRYLGICFQENVFIESLTVKENLEFFAALKGVSKEELEQFIDVTCKTMNLTKSLDDISGSISGGQKRKLSIALSIIGNPPIIIMDEPIAGVDSLSRTEIWRAIASLKDSSVIVTSHSLEEAASVATNIMLVYKGNIEFNGSIESLKEKFKSRYILTICFNEEKDENNLCEIFEFIKSFVSDIQISKKSINIPECEKIPEILEGIEENSERFGIRSFSFIDESLEDIILRMIKIDDENSENNRA